MQLRHSMLRVIAIRLLLNIYVYIFNDCIIDYWILDIIDLVCMFMPCMDYRQYANSIECKELLIILSLMMLGSSRPYPWFILEENGR